MPRAKTETYKNVCTCVLGHVRGRLASKVVSNPCPLPLNRLLSLLNMILPSSDGPDHTKMTTSYQCLKNESLRFTLPSGTYTHGSDTDILTVDQAAAVPQFLEPLIQVVCRQYGVADVGKEELQEVLSQKIHLHLVTAMGRCVVQLVTR